MRPGNSSGERNEHQRGDGGEDQAADHGAAERRVLLAALAEAQRHRRHADDHRQRRHQHRAEAHEAGFQRRGDGIAEFGIALAREADHQHAVGGGDAHAHDRAGQRRHRQRGVGGEQHPDDAGQRRRQRGDDHERIDQDWKFTTISR
jgi:hypothetical protein